MTSHNLHENSSQDSPLVSHLPVMVDEIVECFANVPAGVIVDATFGLGGHATAILNAYPKLQVIGLDQDADAIANAERMIANDPSLQGRLTVRRVRFDSLQEVLAEMSIDQISGALFDLGVSSPQLDVAERGFSYRNEGPLDMRMDQRNQLSASDVVNNYDESDLLRLIADNADEKFARRIARAIVTARPITSTTQLADVVVAAIPAPARRTGGHPAKRTFQAIRIEVNKELEILERALQIAIDVTTTGGRIAVLTYHSGENRIVKRVFSESERDASESMQASPYVHESQSGVRRTRRVRAPKYPSSKEQTENRRAKSARLRIIEKTLVEVGN
ncbi:MAG: 16S rRNA (cytosine(1402)-N(4))-methyltransferase RsmH [Actinobacteria bacterium]|jgi:16S rRNA (cytosine1402-N4)-methyltransferase|nr:16S rRNA (cytosine(1402)-N(4))-methyltransferase RsmH [Actinomycetota bacterium]NCW83246.1 16S rRNA (cytosine(1402)-N(4))-methyltransferase RsmH [Acidimicrobiia bacterium]NDB26605.1 16S rRNA (cytosine(1402)-N(4))-methyltransferase RsmH [Actinomycetota bacterium]NDF87751.1 16S rRNA (cytosine(1402)-N(4))-methyltransferase RsmH [Actinomycetota bacterium]HBQ52390.1 16S rRNA (cytosine(1402)-N(4))-methyltransferase [Acidimicrobium sp.]